METQSASKPSKLSLAAAWASLICGIHCMLSPLLLAALPLLGGKGLIGESVESFLILFSIALGAWSLALGFRAHRQKRVLVLFAVAVAILAAGRLWLEGRWETFAVIVGAAILGIDQIINLRLQRTRCPSCRPAALEMDA